MLKCLLISDFAEACCLVDQGERGAEMVSLALENPPDDDAWAGTGLLRVKGMIEAARRSPDWSLALQALDESIQNTQGGGWRPELSITRFRYAECLHNKGDLDAAREQLDQAEALFRDMGMNWWTGQAEGLRGRIDRGEEFVWFAPYVDGPPSA